MAKIIPEVKIPEVKIPEVKIPEVIVCVPVQLDGSVGTEARSIDGLESGKYVEVLIENTHLTNILYVSMDGKQHWKDLDPGEFIRLRGTARHPVLVKHEDWYLKASALDTTYEIILLKEAIL